MSKSNYVQVVIVIILLINGYNISGQNLAENQYELKFENIQISTDDSIYDHHVEPTLALSSNDTAFIGWKDANTHDGGGFRVSFAKILPNGTMTNPKLMPSYFDQYFRQSDPWMNIFNDTIYYSYLDWETLTSGESIISMANSGDFGETWNVVRASYGSGFADKETFTIDKAGNIYLVYDDVKNIGTDIRLSRSFDKGNSFIENITIEDPKTTGIVGPYIETDNNDKLISTWTIIGGSPEMGDIFYDISHDGGNTWQNDMDLNPSYNASTFTVNPNTRSPSKISLSSTEYDENNERLYVVWTDISGNIDQLDWDIYMRYSDNFGSSWSDRIQVNPVSANLQPQWMPDLEIDSQGRVHIVYYDTFDDEFDLKYQIFDPITESFSKDFKISKESTSTSFTRPGDYITIKIDSSDNPHIVWTDGRNNELDIYYAKIELETVPISSSVSPIVSDTGNSPNFYYISTIFTLALVILYKKL